ncbi:MAG: hypothetical protein AABZ06_00430 [Bdellovibrionota bacterium]
MAHWLEGNFLLQIAASKVPCFIGDPMGSSVIALPFLRGKIIETGSMPDPKGGVSVIPIHIPVVGINAVVLSRRLTGPFPSIS